MIPYYVIVVAGGKGTRFGAAVPKLLVPLAGEPIIAHTLRAVAKSNARGVILVANSDYLGRFRAIAQQTCGEKLIGVVPGGATRKDSVRAGMNALAEVCSSDDVVLVHDGARPFASPSLFARCSEMAYKHGAAVVAVPVVDTLKVIENGVVVETPPREKYWRAQTPQGFRFEILREALEAAPSTVTDDASAVEKLGVTVHVVEGDFFNLKITTPQDLKFAECILKNFPVEVR